MKDMDGAQVLVTGGLGFYGSNIVHRLVSLGAAVTVYDACLDPYGWNFANIREIQDRITFVKGDTRDREKLAEHVRGKEYIFDCAAQVSHVLSLKEPFLDVDINCRGVLTILEACRAVNDGATLVYPSTRGVFGKMVYSPVDENHPTDPPDIYGVNKLAAEKYYLLYHRIYGMKTTVLRSTNSYGERVTVRKEDYGLVNWWIRQALRDEQIRIYGEGLQTRDLCYIGDVAEAMIMAARSDRANGEMFVVGSGEETSIVSLIRTILELTGSRMQIEHIPWDTTRKRIEIGNFVFTCDKIRNMLGWEPRTTLRDGLGRTIAFYRERMQEYI